MRPKEYNQRVSTFGEHNWRGRGSTEKDVTLTIKFWPRISAQNCVLEASPHQSHVIKADKRLLERMLTLSTPLQKERSVLWSPIPGQEGLMETVAQQETGLRVRAKGTTILGSKVSRKLHITQWEDDKREERQLPRRLIRARGSWWKQSCTEQGKACCGPIPQLERKTLFVQGLSP